MRELDYKNWIDYDDWIALPNSTYLLGLPVRASNCLTRHGLNTIQQVVKKSDRELLQMRNFGKASLMAVRSAIAEYIKENPKAFVDPHFGGFVLGVRICEACAKRGARCLGPSDSNRALLSAAPDLLEACEKILAACCGGGVDDFYAAIAKVKKAIAKAEGNTDANKARK